MATFDSTKTALSKLLDHIVEGKLQLPDFQRGWVWDDFHIRSLLVSIARSFPIGSVMLLETGGSARFQVRPIEGVTIASGTNVAPENLILDGQQRLTSLTQVLKLSDPVRTRDDKGREVFRNYYIDIERALGSSESLDDAIVALDEKKTLRTNFGRDVVLDLSTRSNEFDLFHFPCNQILNSDAWEEGLMAHDSSRFQKYMEFRKRILTPFRDYQVPVIQLKKETTKEAVCLVFEKVNTGGVPLSVFELATASYAADGFNLRDDWYGTSDGKQPGRHKKMSSRILLRDLQPTEFLQGVTLLHTREKRLKDLAAGRSGKEATALSAKREHVLALPLDAYRQSAESLVDGFLKADQFLRMEGFHHPKFLPYRSQLIPLAVTKSLIGERWLEPIPRKKITRWFWSGVLGELYGGAIETRIALDVQDLFAWINDPAAADPATVLAAGFQPSRLDTLRTRTSAAYRGIYVLLQREGAMDFFWKAKMVDVDREELKIDIHHLFPKDWCKAKGIPPKVYNSIINKTAISYKANRMIGGKAPSEYLSQIQNHRQVQISVGDMDSILSSHLVNPVCLRANDFDLFFSDRKARLLDLVSTAMGKPIVETGLIQTHVEENDGEENDDEDDEDDI